MVADGNAAPGHGQQVGIDKDPLADLQHIQRRTAQRRRDSAALAKMVTQQFPEKRVIFLLKRQRVIQLEQQLRRALTLGAVGNGPQIDPHFFTFHLFSLLNPFFQSRLCAVHAAAVDGKAAGNNGARCGLLNVLHRTGKAAALMGTEGVWSFQ